MTGAMAVVGGAAGLTAGAGRGRSPSVADRGVAVAFHFHPLVEFSGWQQEYARAATALTRLFDFVASWFS